jgi:hypothetical protein
MTLRPRIWLLAGALALPLAAHAEAPIPKPWHYDAWNSLMSPYCPGRTLMDCPSGEAGELREWIADQESAGRSREEVEEQLYAEFGDVILQAPRARGLRSRRLRDPGRRRRRRRGARRGVPATAGGAPRRRGPSAARASTAHPTPSSSAASTKIRCAREDLHAPGRRSARPI